MFKKTHIQTMILEAIFALMRGGGGGVNITISVTGSVFDVPW